MKDSFTGLLSDLVEEKHPTVYLTHSKQQYKNKAKL